MKLISWNVNGLRAAMTKGFKDFFTEIDADAFCIQETKMQEDQIDIDIMSLGDKQYFHSAEKKGYSGTAVFLKDEPIKVTKGLIDEFKDNKEVKVLDEDNEGRIITVEFEKFYLVNCYVPNAKRGLERLDYRMVWEDGMRAYLKLLDSKKPIVYCGDLNVAHQEIDLKNPKSNRGNAGFTDEEREKMTELLDSNFIDTFRYKYPDKEEEYTWWSYMGHVRERNIGWRIDYFVVSDRIKDKIIDAKIHQSIMGSDHCPIELDLDI